MKFTQPFVVAAFALAGCESSVPPNLDLSLVPTKSDVSIDQRADHPVDPGATATLEVVNTVDFTGESWAYKPEDAAVYLRRRLYFDLVEDGFFKRIVDPGEAADLDLIVTLTEFEDEIPDQELRNRDPNKDGRSEMLTEVVLLQRDGGEQVLSYTVSAEVPATGGGPLFAKSMIEEAVLAVSSGLQQSMPSPERAPVAARDASARL